MPEGFGVRSIEIRGFRSARAVSFAPGAVCALVGGPGVGKSNLLGADGVPAPLRDAVQRAVVLARR